MMHGLGSRRRLVHHLAWLFRSVNATLSMGMEHELSNSSYVRSNNAVARNVGSRLRPADSSAGMNCFRHTWW